METVAGALGELRGGTSTGVSLSTTAAFIQIPAGTQHLFLTPRNFTTAVVARIGFCPYLQVLKVSGATLTDYSTEAQDDSVSTSVVLNSLATTDFLYVGAAYPFAGVNIDVDSTNSNASVLAVTYRKNDDTWANITPTDGTTSGGATYAVDGSVTWTVPTDWAQVALTQTNSAVPKGPFTGNKLYWTRWAVSAALDATVSLDHMIAIPRSTNYFELTDGQPLEQRVSVGPEGVAAILATTDAGTASLVVGYASKYASVFA